MTAGIKLTLEQYKAQLAARFPNVSILDTEWKGTKRKHTYRCTCGFEWSTTPVSLNNSPSLGCKACANKDRSQKKVLAAEEVHRRIEALHGGKVRLMGQYRGANVRHRFKCYECARTWKTNVANVTRTNEKPTGCPYCANLLKRGNLNKGTKVRVEKIGGREVKLMGYEGAALRWLLKHKRIRSMKDIELELDGKVPIIRYKSGPRRSRNYYPDFYVPAQNRIVEVKSVYTWGLSTGRQWRKNQAKAKACIAQGYQFTLMVMNPDGSRRWLPADWYKKTRKQVAMDIAFYYADVRPKGYVKPEA